MKPLLAAAVAHRRRKLLLGEAVPAAPSPSSTYTTFVSASYTPDPDGTTPTTLTFTVKDASDTAIAGQAVTYA